jgi:hypothetical protein
MDKTSYKPMIPIRDFVNIQSLGFGKGSQIGIIVNPTRSFRFDWMDHFDLNPRVTDMSGLSEQERAEAHATERAQREVFYARQRFLASHVITSIRVVPPEGGDAYERTDVTPEVLREMDEEVDGRILPLVMDELFERSNGGVVAAKTTFQTERQSVAVRREEAQAQTSAGSDQHLNGNIRD